MRSALAYTKNDALYSDACVGSLSAIPRWRFARVLESRGEEGATPRLDNALSAFYDSTSKMTWGSNVLTEHILNKDPSAANLRMLLYGSLMRAYLYLAGEK